MKLYKFLLSFAPSAANVERESSVSILLHTPQHNYLSTISSNQYMSIVINGLNKLDESE